MTPKQVREDVAGLKEVIRVAYRRIWPDIPEKLDLRRLKRLERLALKGVRRGKR